MRAEPSQNPHVTESGVSSCICHNVGLVQRKAKVLPRVQVVGQVLVEFLLATGRGEAGVRGTNIIESVGLGRKVLPLLLRGHLLLSPLRDLCRDVRSKRVGVDTGMPRRGLCPPRLLQRHRLLRGY